MQQKQLWLVTWTSLSIEDVKSVDLDLVIGRHCTSQLQRVPRKPTGLVDSIARVSSCRRSRLGTRTILVDLVRTPVGAQATAHGVVHFVPGMLGELDVDLFDSKTEDVDAGIDQCFCQFGPLLRRPSLSNIAHQECSFVRLASRASPKTTRRQFTDSNRDPIHICLHLDGVDLTQLLGEPPLHVRRKRSGNIKLKIWHGLPLSSKRWIRPPGRCSANASPDHALRPP